MNRSHLAVRLLVCLALGMACGCTAAPLPATPQAMPTIMPGRTFTIYVTPTLTPGPAANLTPFPLELPGATELPTITPTPRTHVVKAGEDMGGIALRYRVPLKDLMAANPTVNPRLMKVGTVLIVPASALPQPGAAVRPSATQQPVRLEAPRCLPDPAGGAWCFVKVFNQSGSALINVTVQVRLVDATGAEVVRQTAGLPLDLLPAGGMLPLAAYFSAPLPAGVQVGVQVVSALPASAAGDRYPAVSFNSRKIEIAAGGGSAVAGGQVVQNSDPARPAQLVLLVVAYAADGSITAVRRWNSPQPLPAGRPLDFEVRVYASGEPIQRVELFAEARY